MCGIDAVVVGAGLRLDLPELTADFPRVALAPTQIRPLRDLIDYLPGRAVLAA